MKNALEITGKAGALAERQTGDALIGRFIAFVDATPRTTEAYARALRQLFRFFASNGIQQPKRDDILAYREKMRAGGKKPATIQSYMAAARLFFRWTAQEGLYPNIADNIKGAKVDREHKKDYLTARQVKEVLAGIDRTSFAGIRDYALLSLMVTCGLRDIEASRANIGDLRAAGENTVLFVQGKGRAEKAEYVKVSSPVEKAIRDYLKLREGAASDEPLFASMSNNSKGKRLTTRSISGIAKARLVEAGFNSERLTAHSLRHTAVTLSLLAGKNLAEVQQFARHANIATTMIYNHALDRARNGCAEAIAQAIF